MSLSDTALVDLTQAKNYLRIDEAASLQVDAEYVGTGNGSATEFDLDHTPVEGSLKLYVNNVLQVETTDFTISGATITFVTAPTDTYPITASYDYAASTDTFEEYDDELLETLIEAATDKAEQYTGLAFVQRDITETHIGDGGNMIRLYRRPVTDVTSITLGDTALESWTERLAMARVYYDYGFTEDYEVEIVYTAGYGATRAATQALVPNAVTAVLLIVADLYENRGDKIDSINVSGLGSVSYKLPSRAELLLDTLRIGAKGLG